MNIQDEIKFLEESMAATRKYVTENPIDEMVDRIESRETKTGIMVPTVMATKEVQIKHMQETINHYMDMLIRLGELRKRI